MNFPSPGFWASISAAISTIQPVARDRRRPVKIMGTAEGSTIFWMCFKAGSRITRLTLTRSSLMPATPTVVLITVGHRQQSATVKADVRKDFSNIGSSLT